MFETYRRTVLSATQLGVEGMLKREGIVIHVVAQRLVDLSYLLGTLSDRDRLNAPLARADHVENNRHDPAMSVAAYVAGAPGAIDPGTFIERAIGALRTKGGDLYPPPQPLLNLLQRLLPSLSFGETEWIHNRGGEA